MKKEDDTHQRTPQDAEDRDRKIEQEIRKGMKFSMQNLLLQNGSGMLKGGTPFTENERARIHIQDFLDQQLTDSVLEHTLNQWINLYPSKIEAHLKQPLEGLRDLLNDLLNSENLLTEFVRMTDFNYGQLMDEKPYFQQPGDPPQPQDPYTFSSVRKTLRRLREKIDAE